MEPAVIFLWGDRIRVLGGGDGLGAAQVGPGGLSSVLRVLCGEGGLPRRARIIYQPDGLEVRDADAAALAERRGLIPGARACRRRLRRRLAADNPALSDPESVFCLWPAGGPGRATLQFGPGFRLSEVVLSLSHAGVRTEGAWPLSAAAEASANGAAAGYVALVAAQDRALVSWVVAGGDAGAEPCSGDNWAAQAVTSLRAALARFDDTARPEARFALEVGPDEPLLREAAAGLGMSEVGIADLIGSVRRLRPGGLSDFLPCLGHPPGRTSRRAAAVALGLAALGAAAHGWLGSCARERQRREAAEAASRLAQARGEQAQDRERLSREERLASECSEALSPPQHHYELLETLSRGAPASLVVRRLAARRPDFSITGRIVEGAPQSGGDPRAALRRELSVPGSPWTLQGGQEAAPPPDFALYGRFETAGDIPAQASGPAPGAEARLAAALALLPTAAAFDSGTRPWGGRWTVRDPSCLARSGWELRRLTLVIDRPGPEDWPQIVDTIRACCAQPGLTIERLTLASAPDGAGGFTQAELALTLRLRR